MVGAYRCTRGHTWSSADRPGSCPVCGGAAESDTPAAGETPRPFVVAVSTDRPPPSSDDQLTSPHLGLTPATAPASVPADGPTTPPTLAAPDPFAPTRDLADAPTRPTEALRPDVPGFEIVEELGRGGMGVVYKARQTKLNRPVALKMILSGAHAGPAERERFRREAEAVAQLQNPHIVQIFEIGEANGHPYLALEYVDGGSLAAHLTGTPWPAKDAAALVELLARAVHYAHQQGVVHRDLKPGNVLLSNAEFGIRNAESKTGEPKPRPPLHSAFRNPHSAFQPKITDFGLAKRIDSAVTDGGTKTGAVMGTPSYIAPEQASGKTRDVGPPADVYALGAILYELLTGRPPFRGETPLDTVLQVIHDDPVPPKRLVPGVPRDLDTICTTCLAKSPAKRYASALALADDLRRFLDNEPIKARPLSAWGRGVKWARRHPALTVLAAATLVATLGSVAVLSVAYARVADAVAQKEAEAQAARDARAKEAGERGRAEQLAADYLKAKNDADALAAKILEAKNAADRQAVRLREEGERTRRAAFALQLAQVAALCERDPRRALTLLDDDTRCPPDLRDFTWAYLRRLCHREDRVYADHDRRDALAAVAVSANGAFVATGGGDGTIRVWDPRTGRTWALLTGHAGGVRGLAFGPDSAALASVGADGYLRLWEVPATVLETARRTVAAMPYLQPIFKPAVLTPAVSVSAAHAGGDTCVAFAPDGRSVLTGGADGKVRAWDLTGWRVAEPDLAVAGGPLALGAVAARGRGRPWYRRVPLAWAEKAHDGPVLALAVAAGGRAFATGGADRAARVWAADAPMMLWEVPNHAAGVRAVALSPDGRTLATANNGPTPTVRLTDLTAGTERKLIGHTAPIEALAVSPDGTVLASGGADRRVRLWDLEDGRERGELQGHEQQVTALAFGPDRRTVVSVGTDATARVWLTTVRPNEAADVSPAADLAVAAASGTGSPLVVADEANRLQVFLTDLAAPGGRFPPPGAASALLPWPVPLASTPRAAVRTAVVSPDGRLVVVAADDGLYVWRVFQVRGNVPTPGGTMPLPVNRPFVVPTPKPVTAAVADPDGRSLVTVDADGVRVWDLTAVPLIHDRDRLDLHPRLVYPVTGAARVAALDGGRLAVAVEDGIHVVGPDGHELFRAAGLHAEALAFDPRHHQLAAADAHGVIRVLSVGPGGELAVQAVLTGHTDAVHALSFSPDGRTLASGGADRRVLLWDPVTGHERAALAAHADRVIHVRFTADGLGLVTIDRGGTVRRWRTEAPQPKKPPGPPPPTPPGMQRIKK